MATHNKPKISKPKKVDHSCSSKQGTCKSSDRPEGYADNKKGAYQSKPIAQPKKTDTCSLNKAKPAPKQQAGQYIHMNAGCRCKKPFIGVSGDISPQNTQALFEYLATKTATSHPLKLLKQYKSVPDKATLQDLMKIRIKNLKLLDSETEDIAEHKIPAKLHMIWVTTHASPREIEDKYLEMLKSNIPILQSDGREWEFILWVNDENLIPHTVTELSAAGVTIRNIDELNCAQKFKNEIKKIIEAKWYSIAANVLRYMALENHGGIYVDTDFKFFVSPMKLTKTFDFMAGDMLDGDTLTELNSIYSKAHHDILKGAISFAENKLPIYVNSEDWSKNAKIESIKVAGAFSLAKSFYEYAQVNDDPGIIIFPVGVLTDRAQKGLTCDVPSASTDPEDYTSLDIPLIGRDEYAARWYGKHWDGDANYN